jgi:carbonic anhydrase
VIGNARRTFTVLAIVLVAWTSAAVRASEFTADESLSRLKRGNARFVANPSEALPIDVARREELVKGQAPFAAVLSCADSRVPPEVVFHASLGDLFVVRAAGHVADKSILASLEYAVEHLNVPLVVVMGHEMCGAVKATLDTPVGQSLGPNMDYLIKAIRPATQRAVASTDALRLRAAIMEHVEGTINTILDESPVVRHAAERGQIGLVGGYYELSSGRVYFSAMVDMPKAAAAPAVSMSH